VKTPFVNRLRQIIANALALPYLHRSHAQAARQQFVVEKADGFALLLQAQRIKQGQVMVGCGDGQLERLGLFLIVDQRLLVALQ
jgi:hypothetical protein